LLVDIFIPCYLWSIGSFEEDNVFVDGYESIELLPLRRMKIDRKMWKMGWS
jgi:hypothetical protein